MSELDHDPGRLVGEEARKSHATRAADGFLRAYLSGSNILDIGYRGYRDDVVPIVPAAVGIELDYPGYDGRTLPFADGSQDAVFASHCLEHIKDYVNALQDWLRVLKVGGFLVVMVPHQFLYEKRCQAPSRFNLDHKRFYTPASLIAEVETALQANTYRVRHLADNDALFDYALPPDQHSGGCYEIELVLEKIDPPAWLLDDLAAHQSTPPPLSAYLRVPLLTEGSGNPSIQIVPNGSGSAAVWSFGAHGPSAPRILVLKLDHLGDFVIGTPSLRRLRQAFPKSFIRLVVGPWNRAAAEATGLADDVVTYEYFPAHAKDWDGRPVEPVETLLAAVAGHFDIAIDLRVDEDTRGLLDTIQADVRCGIGSRTRLPFLDVALPPEHEVRDLSRIIEAPDRFIGPAQFDSGMPFKNAFEHATDFRPVDGHIVFGPNIVLPVGRFEVVFNLHLTGWKAGMGNTSIVVDVASDGVELGVNRRLRSRELRSMPPGGVALAFENDDPAARFEFRIFIAGHPLRTRLHFGGVRLSQLDAPPVARYQPSHLHNGEQLSLLVQLVADRAQDLYAAPAGSRRLRGDPLHIVIAPLSNSDLRDWPLEQYAGLARLLLAERECTIALVGSAAQAAALLSLEAMIGGGSRVRNLGGSTPWPALPDLLRQADLVIANNSGVGHVAAAAGAVTLAIYSGSHQPQEWGPRGQRSHAISFPVPCSPCGHDRLADCPYDHRCMRGLAVETVLAEAVRLLDGVTARLD